MENDLYGLVDAGTSTGSFSDEALAKVRAELAHRTRLACLRTLSASIAHEINQPLSGVVTNASTCLRMLAADPANIEGARETVRRMPPSGAPLHAPPGLPSPVASGGTPPAGTHAVPPPPPVMPPGARVTPPVSSSTGDRSNTTQFLTEQDLIPNEPPKPPPTPKKT